MRDVHETLHAPTSARHLHLDRGLVPHRRIVYRRPTPLINAGLGLVVLGAVAWAVGTRLYESQQGPQPTATNQEPTLFLNRINGKLEVTVSPIPVRVNFIPIKDKNDGKIVFRQNPRDDGSPTIDVDPSEIGTQYAARVLGAGYISYNTAFGLRIPYQGEERQGGLWFVLCDVNGKLVNIQGKPFELNESPVYVAGPFINVIPEPAPIKIPIPPLQEEVFPEPTKKIK